MRAARAHQKRDNPVSLYSDTLDYGLEVRDKTSRVRGDSQRSEGVLVAGLFQERKDEDKMVILIVILLALIALMPALCMWLWNWLMPYLFSLPEIGYWQAMGLMALSSLLFYRPSRK